ncbi:MAG: DUF1302 domain-containing protein [Pseudomonadales bacterium]|nr:DUF1302 domain-containing protein [Pseudomonadales bacterium]
MRKRTPFKVTALAAAVATTTLLPISGNAYDTQVGDVNVQIDTTLSVGFGWRASDIDYEGVGTANAEAAGKSKAHRHGTGSQDNSNLRYEKGETFSELIKGSIDVDLTYESYGAFIRGRFWYDNVLENGEGGNTLPAFYAQDEYGNPTEPNPKLGRGGEILDAFIWGDWYINDEYPLNMRIGQQVISWGEGVFFPNGINTINPIDVNALLAPGSQLKEALIPVKAFYASLGVNENLSVEFFYQFEWEETRLPGCGTFYSTTDLVGYQGCDDGFYSFGGDSQGTVEMSARGQTVELAAENFLLPRGEDIEGDDDTQYGIAARYFIEDWEMEVAGYYIRYNSRLPMLSGYTPNITDAGLDIDDTLNAAGIPDASGSLINSSTDLATVRSYLTTLLGYKGAAFLLPYAQYIVEYPDDIELFGASLNTTIDFGLPGGSTSVSAEISLRKDQPFQIEDGVLLAGLVGFPSQTCTDAANEYDCYSPGAFEQNQYVPGYIREDYIQGEIAFIHFFDQILGATRWSTILDLGFSHADIPSNSDLLMNSSYNAALATPWFPTPDSFAISVPDLSDEGTANDEDIDFERDYYPDDFAWGYKLRFSGEYNDIYAGVNFIPTISFSHDVSGTTPSPITNFLEDRMSIGLTGEFIYLNMYSVKVGYTNFFGAEPYNQLADRDSYTLSATVSF